MTPTIPRVFEEGPKIGRLCSCHVLELVSPVLFVTKCYTLGVLAGVCISVRRLFLSRRVGDSLMWSAQAQAEGLTLLVANNKTGYFGVNHKPAQSKPYQARVWRGGKMVSLGYFATAKEAALCVARSPEGRAAAAGLAI